MNWIKNRLWNIFYVLAAIGLLDMMAQAWTGGELKIIQTVLGWVFG